MKKILIMISTLHNGGAERSLVNFLNELPEKKYDIDLLLLKREGIFLKQIPEWINVMETPAEIKRLYGTAENKYGFIRTYATLISKIAERNPRAAKSYRWHKFFSKRILPVEGEYDLAIAYLSGEILYFIDEKVKADKKHVWIHNDYKTAQHPKKYDEKHIVNMDKIISVSDECANILKEEFPELNERIVCLPNITSSRAIQKRVDKFYPAEYGKDTINILSIGRLSYQKGFDMAVEAAKLLKSRKAKLRWFVIGSGDWKKRLEQQRKKSEVEDIIEFIGIRENPYPYIKNCDFLVQPSRYEGKSVVLDEAKILGTPIIATNYPTVKDQIIDGKEGIIVPMNAEGIADGIEKLIKDDTLRAHISEYLANNEYGNSDEIEKYIKFMEE